MIRFILLVSAALAAITSFLLLEVQEGITQTFGNKPPRVSLVQWPNHVYVRGSVQICASYYDPDGDRLRVRWTAARQGPGAGSKLVPIRHTQCVRYTAPETFGWETVRLSVTDRKHRPRVVRMKFCILKDDFNAPQSSPGDNCYS